MISGHSHSFDTGIAKALGVNCAIVYNHIIYWLKINAAKGTNIHEGKVWMYETQQAIADCLDYLTIEEVKRAIVKLLKEGLLLKGNFNKNYFDKTSWYTVTDQSLLQVKKTLSKAQNCAIDSAPQLDPKRSIAPSHIYIHKYKQEEKQDIARSDEITEKCAQSISSKSLHARKDDIFFLPDKRIYEGITNDDLTIWKELYPSIDLNREISASIQWLLSNPAKARKKNWRKFLVGWFGRANERASNRLAYASIGKTDRRTQNKDGTPVEVDYGF